jgi:hypothetical protein
VERISVPAGIAAFTFPDLRETAPNPMGKDPPTRNGVTSVTGFPWIQNSANKAQGRQKNKKKPLMQDRLLMIFLKTTNYG